MDDLKQRARRMRSSRLSAWASLALMILFLILTTAACTDKPDPSLSPLAVEGPDTIYMSFNLPNYWRGKTTTATIVLVRELRIGETILATRTTTTTRTVDSEMLPLVEFEQTWPVAIATPAVEYWSTILYVDVVDLLGYPQRLEFSGIGYDELMQPIEAEDGAYPMVHIDIRQLFLPLVPR